jgi:hypothetical protein
MLYTWSEKKGANDDSFKTQLAAFHFRTTTAEKNASCLADGRNWTHTAGSKSDRIRPIFTLLDSS